MSDAANLRELRLEDSYRGSARTLLSRFYVPSLQVASYYRRAVGFFSSEILAAAAYGLSAFIGHDGQMRLVASPRLNEDDIQAISEGYRRKERVVEECLARELARDSYPDPVRRRLEFLAWLVAEGRLEIKIALVRTQSGYGLYHEKLGIFTDNDSNHVVFCGSANETVGGLVSNFEAVDVFRSWDAGDSQRVAAKIAAFDALWNDATENLVVMDFPEASRKRLLEFRPTSMPRFEPETDEDEEAVVSEPDRAKGWGEPSVPLQLELAGCQTCLADGSPTSMGSSHHYPQSARQIPARRMARPRMMFLPRRAMRVGLPEVSVLTVFTVRAKE